MAACRNRVTIVIVSSMRPGEGERRAIVGYHGQYRAAAPLILSSLMKGRLQWIRVADPDASRVDDLQIGQPNRVDAYQVKWSQYGGTFTFNDLVAARRETPALMAQLADGWKRLREAYPLHRVVVHLITNQIPSDSDRGAPVAEPPPVPRHFAAFLEQAWKPIQLSHDLDSIPPSWREAWEALQLASGLSATEFEDFVQNCELEFGYQFPGTNTLDEREQVALSQDLRHVTLNLFETVADPRHIVQLDHDQLLTRLGWSNRFEFRNIHEFPVDEALYQPVESSVRQLQQMIDNLPGGYLGVLGTPGSGKSTMLTQTLRLSSERVVRYYGYVPDDRGSTVLRGESTNFLHDITLELSQIGFGGGRNPNPTDRTQLLRRFYEQLNLLGEDFQLEGRKTLILIDGLDHIEREQDPDRSLLQDLPAPEQVPEGVYFILGSQTDVLPFPSGVQYEVQKPERRVAMQPLNREAVVKVIDQAGLSTSLDERQKERVYYLSDGHPLALMYLLGRLQNRDSAETVDAVLENTTRYEGDIERQYHGYWRQIEENDELVNLLGLLARFRNVIDMRWVQSWSDATLVRRLGRSIVQYFRVEDKHRWYFFHNSFRLFLLRKTAEYPPGSLDESLNRDYHHQLAEKCAQAPRNSYWAWEELYHRALSGEHDKVLDLASQVWFREQFRGFRPSRAIKEDIRLALRAADSYRDVAAIPRLVLSGYELEQRGFYLEAPTLAELLLKVGEGQVASEHFRDGRLLLMAKKEGLRLSIKLRFAGFAEESERLFELAEPLDLLSPGVPVEDDFQHESWDLLETWARAAVHFRNTGDVIETTLNLRAILGRTEQLDEEEATSLLRSRMLFRAGRELLKQYRWADLTRVSDALYAERTEDLMWWFWLQMHAWIEQAQAGDLTTARRSLELAVEEARSMDLDSEARTTLAQGIYRILGDEELARGYVSTVRQPELASWDSYRESGLSPFLQRFRLNRVLFALGDQRLSEEEIVPDALEPGNQIVAYFERALCRIARLWGEAWRGNKHDASIIEQEVRPLLRLPLWHRRSTWDPGASLLISTERCSELYVLLVDSVSQHGREAVERLREAFEQQWNNTAGIGWPNSIRRQVILALWRAGVSRGWAVGKVRELEGRTTEVNDVSSRVDEHKEQIRALAALGERELARASLHGMLSVSVGVGYRKDYQLDNWIQWLGRVNEVEPERSAERIAWFSRAILALETEDRAPLSASNELLRVSFRWSPRKAVTLLWWLSKQGVVRHEEAMRAILSEALTGEVPPTDLILSCLGDIVLPTAVRADSQLAALLIKQTARLFGTEKAIRTARSLMSKVQVYALPSERSGWQYGVGQALEELGVNPIQEVGIAPEGMQHAGEEESSSGSLQLENESTAISVGEVKRRASSLSGLRQLLEEHKDDSYYEWKGLLASLVPSLDSEQVRDLAGLFQPKRYASLALAILSKRLRDLGDVEGAWYLGQQALDSSDALLGWYRWGDGGSRIAALDALMYVNPEQARSVALQTLVQDLTGNAWYPQNIALNLEEILPLLTNDVPTREVWYEIEQYLGALFEGSSLPLNGPERLDERLPDDTAEAAIAELITSHLDHPVGTISQAALRACGNWLLGEGTGSET